MRAAIFFLIIVNIIFSFFKSIKYKYVTSLFLMGPLLVIILTTLGIESGKIILSLIPIFTGLLLLCFSKHYFFNSKKSIIGFLLIYIFYCYYLFSFVHSPGMSVDYGLWKLRQFSVLAVLPALLILLRGKYSNNELKTIENIIVFSSVLLSILLINDFLVNIRSAIGTDWFVRQTVGSINVIWLSRYLGLALIIVNGGKFKNNKLLSLIFTVLMLIASLLTGSKTILFFIVPVIIYMQIKQTKSKKKLLKNIIMVSLIVFGIITFLNFFSPEAIQRRFSLTEGTTSQRLEMYRMSFHSFTQGNMSEIIFGNGVGTVGNSIGQGFSREYPHNIILEILYETGLIGLLLFSILPLYVFRKKEKYEETWIYYAFIIYLLYSFTSGDMASNEWIFIFFALNIAENKNHEQISLKSTKKV